MESRNRKIALSRDAGARWASVATDWGAFGIVMDEAGRLCFTFLPQTAAQLERLVRRRFPAAREIAPHTTSIAGQVRDYFAGKRVKWNVDLNLDPVDGFRRRVLEACRRIPYGSTATYADLARVAGSPGAARAVGSTMANNPLPLIIPCHRVLRSDGSLGGFSSPQGPSQKEGMLRLENPNFVARLGAARRVSRKKSVSTLAFA